MANGNKTKKDGRGRPKKKPKELPEFKSDSEIRDYLIAEGLKLSLELIEMATKKNNIKKPEVTRAKTQQFKTALESLKVVNTLVKDKEIDVLAEKVKLMEEGLIASAMATDKSKEESSEETTEKIEKLTSLTEQLAEIKGTGA